MILISTLWKKGIFRRLLVTFILVLIPICCLGIYIYYLGMNSVKKEISYSMQAQISFYLDSFEKEMDRIRLLQSDLVNDTNLYKLANIPGSMDLYNRTEAVLNLQQRLVAIKNSSAYIKDVIVIIPMTNDSIFASRGLSKITAEDVEILKIDPDKMHNYFIYWKGRLFLSFMRPLEFGKGDEPSQFIIAVELSEGEISAALNQFNNYEESGAVLMNPLQDYFLYTDADYYSVIKQLPELEAIKEKSWENEVKIKGKPFLVFSTSSARSNLILIKYFPVKFIFKPIESYSLWLWLFLLASIVIIVLFSYSTYKSIHKPILELVDSFRKVENGDLDTYIKHNHEDEFRYLYNRFNAMVENLKLLIDQVYKQKIFTQKAELKHLQSQINPHFLYNSFFILYSMVENEDYENTKSFAKQLGGYFQYITRSASDTVKLSVEIGHARTYAEIQAKRFRSRIRLEFDKLPEEYSNIIVPRLIIQPIIENAFEHGLENKQDDGLVKISFSADNQFLYIVIEDNGSGISESELNDLNMKLSDKADDIETTGIVNIHRRIQFKYGRTSGLEICCRNGGGLKISVKIDLRGESINDA